MHLELTCHPATPARTVTSVSVDLTLQPAGRAQATFYISPAAHLSVPASAVAERMDGLWETSCCELFVKPAGGDSYIEFNLSPSSRWAAYAFDGYRAGMRNLDVADAPGIECERQGEAFVLEAQIDLSAVSGDVAASFSVVVEEIDGTKSFWALRHPPEAPDFHHADCFALPLKIEA